MDRTGNRVSVFGIVVAIVATAIGFSTSANAVPGGPAITVVALKSPVKKLVSIDMIGPQFGFAIGGTGQKVGKGYLLATSDGGAKWSVRGELPYGLTNTSWSVPNLHFVSKNVGYTDANVAGGPAASQGVYVTTNGGVSWRRLAFTGFTPTFATPTLSNPSVNESYQISGDVLTLVTLRCTQRELKVNAGNWCPSYLDEFKVGTLRPFRVKRIPSTRANPGSVPEPESVRLLAATGPSSAIIAVGDMEGAFPVLETSDGGIRWSARSNPCYHLRGSTGLTIQVPIQDLRIAPTGWYIACYQGGGMSQGTIYLGKSSDQGRSWVLLSQGSEGATAGNIPFVGNIGDTDWPDPAELSH